MRGNQTPGSCRFVCGFNLEPQGQGHGGIVATAIYLRFSIADFRFVGLTLSILRIRPPVLRRGLLVGPRLRANEIAADRRFRG